MNLSRLSSAAIVLALGLTACGGGGGSSSPVPVTSPPQFQQMAPVTYGVIVPMSGSSSHSNQRRPQFVSPNTGSVTFNITHFNGTPVTQAPVVVNLTLGCTPNTPMTGEQTCTATSQAPVGTDTFVITTYQSTNGTGTPLSQNTVVQAIVAGANSITATLNPVVASLAWTPANSVTIDGTASSGNVALSMKDASGATIVGAQQFLTAGLANDTVTITCQTHLSLKQPDGTTAATLVLSNAAANNAAKAAYDGVSLGVNGGTVTCTATDTSGTPLTATFTLYTSPNGNINWTIN